MKKWLGISALLLAPAAFGQTISKPVHVANCSATNSPTFSNPGKIATMVCPLPEPALSGNAVIVGVTASGTLAAPTDDKGDTFTQLGSTSTDATNVVHNALWCSMVTAGAQVITFNSSGSTNNNNSGFAAEFNDVTNCTMDVGTSHVTTGVASGAQTLTGGSATPTASGDLIIEYMTLDTATNGACTAGSNTSITWNLGGENTFQYSCWQWGQYNSTSALNPNFNAQVPASSSAYNAIWASLKTSSTGTAIGTGLHAISWFHQNSPNPASVTATLKFPVYGNTHVILHSVASSCYWTGITSSPALTWTLLGSTIQGPQYSGIWYAKNDTSPSSAMTISPTTLGGCNGTSNNIYTAAMIDLVNGATNPIDTGWGTSGYCATSGNPTSGGGNITGPTCTPSFANEVILLVESNAADSSTGFPTPSGNVFMQDYYTCQASGCTGGNNGPNGYTVPTLADENDGWAIFEPGSTLTAQTWTMSHDTSTNTNLGNWSMSLGAFIPQLTASPGSQVNGGVQITGGVSIQ